MRFMHSNHAITNYSKDMFLSGLSIFVIACIWQLVSSMEIINPLFLPSPASVILAGYQLFSNFGFLNDIGISFYRVLCGYFLSILFAVPIGLILGYYFWLNSLAMPFISFFRFVPVSAFVPLLILWFGIGELQKIFLIFIGVSFYLLAFVISHVRGVSREYVESALTLGAKTPMIITRVLFPACSREIYNSIRDLFGGGWTLIVLAELVAAESGVGKVIIDSQRFLHTDRLIAAIAILGGIGFLSDYFLRKLEPLFFTWRQMADQDGQRYARS